MKRARILCFCLLALLGACAAPKKVPTAPPEDLYRQAVKAIEKSDWAEAQRLLDHIRDESPFSNYAVEAELLSADSLFKQEKWEEAAGAYKTFTELHPTHPKAAYAQYNRGLAYLKLAQKEDRDQTGTRNAAEAFQKLLNAYPASEFTEDARKRLAQARETLASHELHVARYYVRRKKYDAAVERIQVLLRNYPDAAVVPEAWKLVAELEAKKK
ncbi:MAG: outer membrane protein assembly factor BamD [Deltaproteobacteria bacterium]|nr:outer membrane protein assembly factor BamD [Deltaproteobacteria bacterium]